MPKYSVMINGENFLLCLDGEEKKMGFYVVRYVEADCPENAELAAVKLVRGIGRLRAITRNTPDDPPMMYLEEMHELASFDDIENLEPGLGFYVEGEEQSEEIYPVAYERFED